LTPPTPTEAASYGCAVQAHIPWACSCGGSAPPRSAANGAHLPDASLVGVCRCNALSTRRSFQKGDLDLYAARADTRAVLLAALFLLVLALMFVGGYERMVKDARTDVGAWGTR
jgi:hypothetical protein